MQRVHIFNIYQVKDPKVNEVRLFFYPVMNLCFRLQAGDGCVFR